MQILPSRAHLGPWKKAAPSRARLVDPIVRVGDHNDPPTAQVGDVYDLCVSCRKVTRHRAGVCQAGRRSW